MLYNLFSHLCKCLLNWGITFHGSNFEKKKKPMTHLQERALKTECYYSEWDKTGLESQNDLFTRFTARQYWFLRRNWNRLKQQRSPARPKNVRKKVINCWINVRWQKICAQLASFFYSSKISKPRYVLQNTAYSFNWPEILTNGYRGVEMNNGYCSNFSRKSLFYYCIWNKDFRQKYERQFLQNSTTRYLNLFKVNYKFNLVWLHANTNLWHVYHTIINWNYHNSVMYALWTRTLFFSFLKAHWHVN